MSKQDQPTGEETKLQFARFEFRARVREALILPAYKGAVLRGGFGHVLRRLVCLGANRGGGECLLGEKCLYHYVFETPLPRGSAPLGKVPTAPHPFVIEPPLEAKRVYEPGEALSFDLVLFGKALEYLPYFIYAFDELGRLGLGGRRAKFSLETVSVCHTTGEATQIYQGIRRIPSPPLRALRLPDLSWDMAASTITLRFCTPTRLKFDNRLYSECDFAVLYGNLRRRIGLLDYFHCSGEWRARDGALSERAKSIQTCSRNLRWVDWERYSGRQKTTMNLGGVVGEVTYGGDLKPFLPYLALGTYTHIGKGTSFGLGKYEIVSNRSAALKPQRAPLNGAEAICA